MSQPIRGQDSHLVFLIGQKNTNLVDMVPTDHDIPFSRTFQGLLRYIFKDFSRTFLCSFKHPFAKNDKQWTFQIRHIETINFDLEFVRKMVGGDLDMCFLTFLDDLQFCLKGGSGGPPPEKIY